MITIRKIAKVIHIKFINDQIVIQYALIKFLSIEFQVLVMSSIRSPKVAVDGIVLYNKKIVLIKRKNPPFKGRYAIPGGFVEYGETTESALKREVREETGLNTEIIDLVGVYSDPDRDPRGHVISICYLALGEGDLNADTDAESVNLFPVDNIPALAFDHNQMINDAKEEINEILSKM